MRSEASAPYTTVEKLATSQKLVSGEVGSSAEQGAACNTLFPERITCAGLMASPPQDVMGVPRWALSRAGTDSRLHFGPDHGGIGDIMSRLRCLEEPGYDAFRGMSLEELGAGRGEVLRAGG